MHLLNRLFSWLKQTPSDDLLHKSEFSSTCARDVGISVTRVRLPSGSEILLVETHVDSDHDNGAPGDEG